MPIVNGKKQKSFSVDVEDDIYYFVLEMSNRLSELTGVYISPTTCVRKILRDALENSKKEKKESKE